MRRFLDELEVRNPEPAGRRWVFVPYDQLTDRVGPLAEAPAGELGVVMLENPWKAARRPYHRQKLALILANMRHFALEQAERGVCVRYGVAAGPYREALAPLAEELGGLTVMEPAERELRRDLEPLRAAGLLEQVPHLGWLTTVEQFAASQSKGPPWRMDAFYRRVRRDSGLLMEDGKPLGGKYSHDAANRQPWPGEPPAPSPPRYEVDAVTHEVVELIERRFSHHPGTLRPEFLPASAADTEAAWRWARSHCLEHFGPYEDAMAAGESGLFHTRLSPLLNLCRLLPGRLVEEAAALDIPLASKEGFIRQVAGWREFMRHVHRETDGFRKLPGAPAPPLRQRPGDGGYSRWSGTDWGADEGAAIDGGAAPSALGAAEPLPPAFWDASSGLRCLDTVVRDVWEEAWGHHITRLMVLSNLATLLDVEPRELTDWFWVAYADAFDWVVEPNVLGMGTYGLGELITTKPYVSGAAYIHRMSDYCGDCPFDPKRNCPITHLYWAFLARHREALEDNPRLRLPLASLRKRGPEKRGQDARAFEQVRDTLAAGGTLQPSALSPPGGDEA